MGIVLMRPLTSGVFQRLMAEVFPEIDAVASDGWSGAAAAQLCAPYPYVDVALVGMREPRTIGMSAEWRCIHQATVMGYLEKIPSPVTNTASSTIAWAINNRSKGSL